MPRYAPLPAVNIDPRNEAQLVNEAAKRVYDASDAKLNDFSAGNPMMALIEGQAFAQGEFLFWANQLPESILLEWIGPFLGAMRRIGTPSISRLNIEVTPGQTQQLLPAGTIFTTNSNLTGGEAIEFITNEDLVFPASEGSGSVAVSSVLIGAFNNVAPNTITQAPSETLQFNSVTNPVAAVGGSDIETLDQVKERFFTLIRRRNPVSAQDWRDLFEDLFGVGTFTSVLPGRSTKESYIWLNDYLSADGHVSFFFLNPDGTEPTVEQVKRAQNTVNFSMPMEMQGHVYPLDLSQVQFELTLGYDPTSDYAGYLRNFSLGVRDDLFTTLTPGQVFPSGYEPSVADVDSALLETFPPDTKYSEPDIEAAVAYNTPLAANAASITSAPALPYEPQGFAFRVNDLLTIGDPQSQLTEAAWPVVEAYTPYSSTKVDQLLYQNLKLTEILPWQPGSYSQGQVFRNPDVENSLLVVLREFEYTDPALPPTSFILEGVLSAPKDFVAWDVGSTYYANSQETGFYDPDLVEFDQELADGDVCQRKYFEPSGDDNLAYRVGWYVYVVNQDFVLLPSSNTLTGAQSEGLVSNQQVVIPLLKSGGSYSAGTWIKTPTVGSGPDIEVDPYYYYVDISKGVITRYAYVNEAFTFLPAEGETLADSFSSLIEKGVISSVSAKNAEGVQSSFQYKPRFAPQTYLSYKASATSSVEYYFTLTGLTPYTTDPQEMVRKGLLARVDTNVTRAAEYLKAITPDPQTGLRLVCPPLSMFVFAPGDVTLFRQQNQVISYVATQHFSPAFTPGVYIENGVLVPGGFVNSNAIPFFGNEGIRPMEDFVISADGKNIYRVMRFFTSGDLAFNWDGVEVPNTARLEELSGNLLRVVTKYICEENILAPNGPATSGLKLGVAQITLQSKSGPGEKSVFVWENTNFSSQVPQLSYATGAKEVFAPVSYGDGTLAL
jgi:hypothetical protein